MKANIISRTRCGSFQKAMVKAWMSFLFLTCSLMTFANNDLCSKRVAYARTIHQYFPAQLVKPMEKNRRALSQFGYNLEFFAFPLFPIRDFIPPHNFGRHAYNKAGHREKNGALYTCKGGFIDFSHLRTSLDWTVYLAFTIITSNQEEIELPPVGGALKLQFGNVDELTLEDVASLAQKIAFEKLVWHEAYSWYYHRPNYKISQQQSAFTPEDLYSDLLGSYIGKKVVLRILKAEDHRQYSEIATDEIEKVIATLEPVDTKKESRLAYDLVDRSKQLKLPVKQRNDDVWYDSKIIFRDQRYVFKRLISAGPELTPWLVPKSNRTGCSSSEPRTLKVPQQTQNGISFYYYYTFQISPDSSLFYNDRTGNQMCEPFTSFSTRDFSQVIHHIRCQMENVLLPGFDKRNHQDPVPGYKGVRKVLF